MCWPMRPTAPIQPLGNSPRGETALPWLSTLPANTAQMPLVAMTMTHWRIEHDDQARKPDLRLAHYHGRAWCAFHHLHRTGKTYGEMP